MSKIPNLIKKLTISLISSVVKSKLPEIWQFCHLVGRVLKMNFELELKSITLSQQLRLAILKPTTLPKKKKSDGNHIFFTPFISRKHFLQI